MTGISRVLFGLIAAGCGYVVVGVPSEIDQLAIGQALGRGPALVIVAAITAGAGLAAGTTSNVLQIIGLRLAGVPLIAYGILAVTIKGGVALPTAALAVACAIRALELAAELSVKGPICTHREPT